MKKSEDRAGAQQLHLPGIRYESLEMVIQNPRRTCRLFGAATLTHEPFLKLVQGAEIIQCISTRNDDP